MGAEDTNALFRLAKALARVACAPLLAIFSLLCAAFPPLKKIGEEYRRGSPKSALAIALISTAPLIAILSAFDPYPRDLAPPLLYFGLLTTAFAALQFHRECQAIGES